MYVFRIRTYGFELGVSGGAPNLRGWHDSNTNFSVESPRSVADGKWHHLVGTLDGSSIRLYVDGVLVDAAPSEGSLYTEPSSAAAIGRDADHGSNYFDGEISEVAYYDHALTEAQVRSHVLSSGNPLGSPLSPSEASALNASMKYRAGCAADPCNTLFGNFFESTADVAVPGRGMPLRFERTYNSVNAATDGPLGFGWRHSYQMSLVESAGAATVFQENGATVDFTDAGGSFVAAPRVLAELVQNPDGSWTFTRRNRQLFEFDAQGRLVALKDLNGYATTVAYDGTGRVSTVTDPAGRALTFAYDLADRISSVTDNVGRVVSYGHDGAGNLVSVTDVGGRVTTYGYDGAHRVLTKLDPNQQALPPVEQRPVTNHYDAQGRVDWQEDRLGGRTTFSYGSYGSASITSVTDPLGNVRQDWYDSLGRRVAVARGVGTPQQAIWGYEYDPVTWGVTTATDPNGHAVTMTYDTRGNVLTRIDALDRTWTFTYNQFDQPLTVEDPTDVTTTYVYDGAGNLLSESRPLTGSGQTASTTYTYGDGTHPGDVTSMTDPTGIVTTFAYDANGYRASAQDPSGKTRWLYDTAGRPTGMIPPNGNVGPNDWWVYIRLYTTNAYGDITIESHPGMSRQTTIGYDANRNVVSVTDPTGKVTGYEYDADDRQTAVVRADTTRVETVYDANNNVVVQRDGAGRETLYTYDPLDRLVTEHPPVVSGHPARVTTYGYDLAGNVTTLTDPAGQVTTFGYDVADQLTGIDFSGPATPDVSFTYDPLGRRATMVDGSGTWGYDRDSLGRLTSSTDDTTTVGYGYDLAGRLTTLTYPGNKTVTYGRDTAGRLESLTDWLDNQTTFSWDPNGNLIDQSTPNGVDAARSFNLADELTNIAYTDSTTTLGEWSYGRDAKGFVTSSDPGAFGAPAETYGYTARNQLHTVNSTQYYANDDADNLTQQILFADSYDEANQLTTQASIYGTTTFGYDANGNRTTRTPAAGPATSYGYDQANRLTSVSGTTNASYTYNGDGLRTAKTVDTTTTEFTWDLSGPMPMLLDDGTNNYVYGPDGTPLAHIDQATDAVTWYGHDTQASTRLLTDDTGTVTGTYRYAPYGIQLDHTGPATTPLRYAGQYTDNETGFQYLRARYYDPGTGNFLTRDPIDTLTRAPYAYVGGNPLNYTDPSGLYWGESFVEGAKDAVGVAVEVTSTAVNTATGVNAIGLGYGALTSGGNCYFRDWRIECDGVAAPRPFTVGNIVLNPDTERLSDEAFAHEAVHTSQWGLFGGPRFVFAYSADWLQAQGRYTLRGRPEGCDFETLMLFENWAGLKGGDYECSC